MACRKLVVGIGTALAVWGLPVAAEACGGFFCDAPGSDGQPVDQTGETIVFARDGAFVEAHVQINYDGEDATQFSWIVPVPVVPQIEIGSQRFIDELRDATVPFYSFSSDPDHACNQPGRAFVTDSEPSPPDNPQPDVLTHETVGAFEYAVLQGGTSSTVMAWLEDNGYSANPIAPGLFDAYLEEGSVFVAFRLTQQADVEELHPIVIRYEGDEPCIPLRLTAVAAKEDMDVRALFLGEDRTMPLNYKHVRINDVRLDWANAVDNYADVVSMAIDEAGGRAFVTEYAGSSDVVSPQDIIGGVDASAFTNIDVLDVVATLVQQGLMSCTDSCGYRHPLVASLLREFIPAPRGVDADVFYACLHCYERLVDHDAWDSVAFEQRFRESISDPIEHATTLVESSPYLTRMYTRISPYEMTADPMFVEVEGLTSVPNRRGAEQTFGECCASTWELPDGTILEGSGSGGWDDSMPFAAVIQQTQPQGPPAIEVDNRQAIATLVDARNELLADGCEGTSTGSETGDPTMPSTTGAPSTGAPSSGETGESAGTSGGAGASAEAFGGGCAIDPREDGEAPWWGALAVIGLAAWRRRA